MSYIALAPQPGARDPALGPDEVGPGLYPGETALALDSGECVAVSVTPRWLENNAGVAFQAWARWIEADGATKLIDGQHVETAFTHTGSATEVADRTVAALAKEMLLIVLGETATRITIDDGAGGSMEVDLIPLGEQVRLNVSIRRAIACAEAAAAAGDPATLLGL